MKPLLLGAVLITSVLGSCVLSIGGSGSSSFGSTSRAQELRRETRNRLAELRIGMDRAEIDAVMGTGAVRLNRDVGWVDRPYRTSRYTDTAGREIEVLGYYTDLRVADDRITDDELTPVVLADGRLIAWGRDQSLPAPAVD